MGGLLQSIAQGPNSVNYYNDQAAQVAQRQAEANVAQKQAQGIQIANIAAQRKAASQDAIAQAWRQAGGDLDGTVRAATQQPGVLPEDLIALQKHVNDTKKGIADLEDKALEQRTKHSDIAAGQLNALLAQPEDQAAQAWGATVSKLISEHDVKPEDLQAAGLNPAQYPGHAAIQNFMLGLSGYKNAVAAEQKNREIAAQEKTAEAAASNATVNVQKEKDEAAKAAFDLAKQKRDQGIQAASGLADTNIPPAQFQQSAQPWAAMYPELAKEAASMDPSGQLSPIGIAALQRTSVPVEKQPEFDLQEVAARAAKSANPAGDVALVDSVIDPTKNADLNARTKGQVASVRKLGMKDPSTAIAAILKDASDQIGHTETAVATAKAEEPIKIGEANINRQAALDLEKYKKASDAYNKSGLALATATTAADDIQKVLDLAGSGNKAAAANVPLVGVGALNAINGIKRINSAEIAQYGTAGSLVDRIQGKLQGWTEGQPIPKDVLEDMKKLHGQLSEGATEKHALEVQAINKAYDQKFKPMEFAKPAGAAALPSGHKVGDAVKIKGKQMKITAIHSDGTFDAH